MLKNMPPECLIAGFLIRTCEGIFFFFWLCLGCSRAAISTRFLSVVLGKAAQTARGCAQERQAYSPASVDKVSFCKLSSPPAKGIESKSRNPALTRVVGRFSIVGWSLIPPEIPPATSCLPLPGWGHDSPWTSLLCKEHTTTVCLYRCMLIQYFGCGSGPIHC